MSKESEYDVYLKLLKWLLVIPFVLAIGFGVFFFSDFPEYTGTEKSWLNTAQIINGVLTPILTLASIILLGLTWLTTKKELKIQLLRQQKQENIEFTRIQSKALNDKMQEQVEILSILDPHTVFDFLEKLYSLQNFRLTDFYSDLDFPDGKVPKKVSDYCEYMYTDLKNIRESRKFLISEGARISICYGSVDEVGYFKKVICDEKISVRRVFLNVFAMLYIRSLEKHQEVKSFNYLMKKIQTTNGEYRDELKVEFKLVFDNEISERLLQFNDDIPNGFLDV